jgi:DNA adenine methylase
MNKSPLRYPGGKTRACSILNNVINKYYDITKYNDVISPFFGGGSFEFFLQNKYKIHITANDKFVPLYNFWNQSKNNKDQLVKKIDESSNVTKDIFSDYRKVIMTLDDPLLQASYYFVINRCSFSGSTLSGGFSEEASKKRFNKSSIERVNKLNLSNIDFYNDDYVEFINKNYNDNKFMFLDPPYYLGPSSKLYGMNGDMHENFNHVILYDLIKDKQNWIMTYNDCEFVRLLYKDHTIIDAQWSYGMNKTKKSSEIIILSKN